MRKKSKKSPLADALADAESRIGDTHAAWNAFELLFRTNPQPMWIYDRPSMRFLEVNEAAVRIYGYSRDEFLSMTLADIRPPEDVSRLQSILAAPPEKGYKISAGWQHRRKDGSFLFVTIHSHEMSYQGHDAALVMAADVTELHELIEKLEEQTAYFQQLFTNSPDGIVLLDGEGRVVDVNGAFQTMFGYERAELVGHSLLDRIIPAEDAQESISLFSRNVQRKEAVRVTTTRHHRDGRRLVVEILAYPVRVKDRDFGVFAIYHDVTDRHRAQAELEYRARHDMLTELVNRGEFVRNVQAMLDIARAGSTRHALLYVDIDQFKVVNDICGHSAGDRAIVELSGVLKAALRGRDTVGRLGGDEFGVLLPDCDRDAAMTQAQRVLEAVGAYRFNWNTRQFPIAVSIGVVEIGADMANVEEVLSAADAACHAAKEKGRNRVQRYDAADAHFVSRRQEMAWVSRLSAAIEENRFVLFCQDVVPLSQPAGARRHREILVRYRDADGGLVGPGLFVPSAERYNLMPAIDRWVLRTVCERVSRCETRGRDELLSINVSGTTLSDEQFPDFVKHVLGSTGTEGSLLCFEITETAAISNLALAKRFIEEMKALGCGIALDDFGSGMSSFSYLRELNVDYLKIDGTFVRNLHASPVDRAMTEAINNVGRILGLRTVAEFAENMEIVEQLRAIGVDYAQGYGLHRPEPWREAAAAGSQAPGHI